MSDYKKKSVIKDINVLVIGGNIGKIKELKYFDNGGCVLSFSVASSNDYKNNDGEVVEQTVWIDVNVTGKWAESLNEHKTLEKIKHVTVTGRLKKARGWIDNNGGPQASMTIDADSIHYDSWKNDSEDSEEDDVKF